jgi:hypothetical protein
MPYKALGGSSRRYVNTETGETIARRQYENERARDEGFSSWSEYQGLRRDQTYMRWLSLYAVKQGVSEREARRIGSGFNAGYTRAQNDGWSRDAKGSFADFLVDIGEREDDWEWDVGDTGGQPGQ